MFDTHAHLNFADFSRDREQIIKKCRDSGIFVINVGTNYMTSKIAVEIAESHEGIYASIGLHALNISQTDTEAKVCAHSSGPVLEKPEDFMECEFDYDLYKNLARSKKVVAIGEVGLDYYYKPKTNIKLEAYKFKQLEILSRQVELAQELDLPLIIHVRMAHEDLISHLEEEIRAGRKFKGVIHCFTGTLEQAKKYIGMGFLIGLNGIIFKIDLNETIRQIPKDKIIFETDCPFLAPPQISGRNEPSNVKYVVERVAQIRSETAAAIEEYSTYNAKKLFKIF